MADPEHFPRSFKLKEMESAPACHITTGNGGSSHIASSGRRREGVEGCKLEDVGWVCVGVRDVGSWRYHGWVD